MLEFPKALNTFNSYKFYWYIINGLLAASKLNLVMGLLLN